MQIVNRAAGAAALIALMAIGVPAIAQYGGGGIPGRTSVTGSAKNSSFYIYPGATFIASGLGLDASLSGILFGADTGMATKDEKYAGQVGAWYFYHDSNSDLYEFHVRGFVNRQFGVQVGILGSSNTSVNPVDVFGLYTYESRGLHRWSAQVGLGIFSDPLTDTGLSFFLQGTTPIARNLDLNASYWYVRDGDFDVHRIAVGVGLRF